MIGDPLSLPGDVMRDHPELSAARWRRGGLPPRIGGWFLGGASVAAITLRRTVWLGRDTPIVRELLLHELRHVAHFQASRAFPILYLWETLRRGYQRNRYEVDARHYAARMLGRTDSSN